MDLVVPMEFPQGSQAWSHLETCNSAFLSSCNSSARLPVEWPRESVAFSRGLKGLPNVPSCCESTLGVTVESVQGNQVYLQWIGTSGSFGFGAQALEFHSSFKLRLPALEL